MKVSMTFTGGDQLATKLRSLPSAVNKKVLREALTEGAQPMRSRMASMAPRGDDAPHVADNIGISNVSKLDGVSMHEQEAAVAVGPKTGFFYAFYQEFGTVHHGAQSFVRPAYDQEAPRALQAVKNALWTALARMGVSGISTGGRNL